jgi:rhamnulokinase
MGIETRTPIVTAEAMSANFTNELGVDGTVRFLKNIAGLWLLQECRRRWAEEGDTLSYDQIVDAASGAPAFRSTVDPDWPGFLHPADMREAIGEFCRRTDQPVPGTVGEFARSVFESLALKYRLVLEELRRVSGRPVRTLHVIGGGSRNRFLCQCTANATGLPVMAGPAEATALGNLMLQARTAGAVSSLAEMRQTIGRSFTPARYEPRDAALWDSALDRLRQRLHLSSPRENAP